MIYASIRAGFLHVFWVVCWCLWTSGQVANIIPKVFPEEPSSYLIIEDKMSSGDFEAPEDGWYQLAAVGAGGRGGSGFHSPNNYHAAGGGGGSPGIAIKTNIKLSKGEKISCIISGNVTINDDTHNIHLKAGRGGEGGKATDGPGYPANNGYGGAAGNATGGDINISGSRGNSGYPGEAADGGVTTNDFGISAYGGKGGYFTGWTDGSLISPTSGNAAFIRFYRGNTNLPLAQLNALDITEISLEMNRVAQEQTSVLLH